MKFPKILDASRTSLRILKEQRSKRLEVENKARKLTSMTECPRHCKVLKEVAFQQKKPVKLKTTRGILRLILTKRHKELFLGKMVNLKSPDC